MEIEYDIFISFKNSDKDGNRTEDRELAYRLYNFLKSKNLKIFFSEATLQELGADSWGDEIEDDLRASKIFIALGTKEKYFSSYWIQRERTTFLTLKRDDKSKAIYSYIASPMTTRNLPNDIKEFECFEDTKPNEFERLYSFISNRLFGSEQENKDENIIYPNPYKGLQSFTYEDRENYYGRKKEAQTIAKKIKNSRFFTLLGASGSGKSSFLFAGIIPILKESEASALNKTEIVSFRPLDDPFKSLASAFIPTLYLDKIDRIEQKEKLTNKLINFDVKLNNLVESFLEESKSNKLYLIIDQFEELFTLTKQTTKRDSFLEQLLTIINSKLDVTLIISMRSDFLSHFSNHAPFNQAFNESNNYILGRFDRERLREVIEEPSKKLGVTFQNGLIEKIIDEISKEAGQLPLLEFALHQLWIHKKGRVISFESQKEIKSISKSISHYADEVYKKYIKIDSSIKRIFINLVSIGRGTEDTKKRAKLDEFRDEDRETITLLANERLIVTNKDEIEIVHEALIREWRQLKKWIDEYRDFLQWQERLREDRVFYKEKGDLLKDSKLLVARDFLESHREYIFDVDKWFIEESIKINKKTKRNKWILFIILIFFLLEIIWIVWSLKKEADLHKIKAEKISESLVSAVDRLFGYSIYISENDNSEELETYQFIIKNFKRSTNKKLIKLVEYSYYSIGNIYYSQKKYQESIENFKKAIEKNPKKYGVYNNIGNAYSAIELYQKSIQSYKKALEINPNRILAYLNLFELQLTQNQLFDKKQEQKYIKLFQNKKESFIYYEMLKILQDTTHNKKVNLKQWKQKYREISLGGWNFNELNKWIDGVNNKKIKDRLKEALGVFEEHS